MASKEVIDPNYPDLIPGDERVLDQYNFRVNHRSHIKLPIYPVRGTLLTEVVEQLPQIDENVFLPPPKKRP